MYVLQYLNNLILHQMTTKYKEFNTDDCFLLAYQLMPSEIASLWIALHLLQTKIEAKWSLDQYDILDIKNMIISYSTLSNILL